MRRWFRRREPVAVPLDPAQVMTLRFLYRFKAAPEDRLWQEATQTFLYLSRREYSQALADMAARDLIASRLQPEDGATWFVVGELGRKVKSRLPYGVKSAIVVYV